MIAYKPSNKDKDLILNLDMCNSIEINHRIGIDNIKVIFFRFNNYTNKFEYSNKEADKRYNEIQRLVGIKLKLGTPEPIPKVGVGSIFKKKK